MLDDMSDNLKFHIIESGTSEEDAAFEIQEQHRRFFFVPEPVFRKAVINGLLLGAFERGKLVAYIWSSLKDGTVRVLYLSVHRDHTRKGIGRQLVDELKRRYADAFRIRLSCRTDYPGWKFWKGVGFRAMRNRPGRAKAGSEVTDFVFELSPLPLFADFPTDDERPKVAIDSNIYFDLCDELRPHHLESSGLLADWIESEFNLCVTAALSEDISRGAKDDNCVVSSYNWPVVKASKEAFQCIHQQVISLIGPGTTDQDNSDRNHLAHSIAENVYAFVTRDSYLLENSDRIYDQFGTSILRPVDFVVNVDTASNQLRFDRKDLSSVRLSITRTVRRDGLNSDLANLCRQNERVSNLKAKLRGWLANPDRFDVFSILDASNTTQAICAIEKSGIKVIVHLLRSSVQLKGKRKGRTIIRCLAAHLRSRFSDPTLIEISDNVGVSEGKEALEELGFFFHKAHAYKVSLPGVWELQEVYEAANDLIVQSGAPNELPRNFVPIKQKLDPLKYLQLEHQFWPAKLNSGGSVSCIVVPIRPVWARALFDPNLGQPQLWDEDANLLLNPTNAYYTAARPSLKFGRILWYVSHSNDFPGSMRIRACSQMTRRVIGPPLQSYREFRHFGVYQLTDIKKLSKHNRPDVMAIEFRDTELFPTPVSLPAIRDVLNAHTEAFQWPTKIEESKFLEIFQRGSS